MRPRSLSRAIESIREHLGTNSFHEVFKSAFDGNEGEAEHEAPEGGHQGGWMLPSMSVPLNNPCSSPSYNLLYNPL